MPRLPIDYSKTIMYKLCCLDQSINDIYIGYTTDFTKRKANHKHNCNYKNRKEYNRLVYQFIREHGGFENWQMIQIEEYPCKNKREAEARETYWMKELNSTLNIKQSFLTQEEKKEYQKQYQKEYENTDKRKEYENTDKRKEYKKEYMKEYAKTNKRKEYMKQYYQTKALYLNELKCYNF